MYTCDCMCAFELPYCLVCPSMLPVPVASGREINTSQNVPLAPSLSAHVNHNYNFLLCNYVLVVDVQIECITAIRKKRWRWWWDREHY